MLYCLSNSVQCTIFDNIGTIFNNHCSSSVYHAILARASEGVSPKASL